MFAGFILTCGTTHMMSVRDLWHSTYRLEGLIKGLAAALSIATALATVKIAPIASKMPSPEQLERINQSLREEIEARKDAEEKLRRRAESDRLVSEAKLSSYFESASQAIIAVLADGHIVLVNRRTEEMFGYARDELLGQELEILLPERDRAVYASHRAQYFAEPHVRAMGVGLDLAGRRKDGTEFPVEIGLSFVQDESGLLAFGLVTDITERKRAADRLARVHAELKASEAKLRSYFESAAQGILAAAADGRITLVNRRTEEMFGYTRDELLGQQLELLVPERYRAAHVRERAGYFAKPYVRPMDSGLNLFGRRKDGTEFPADISLGYIETEEGILTLAVMSDITERKRAVEQLARINTELRSSNAELEQFAYVASHDLQEPLRMITSYLHLLERRYNAQLDADAREFIHFAVDGANRMKVLIRDLLSISRAGTQAVKSVDVPASAVLQNVLHDLKATIEEKGAAITFDPLPTIFADPGLIARVFQNLIGNAIKFHREGAPQVHVSASLVNDQWVFSVRDNGIGIEPQHADRIFQIFQRLHGAEAYPGTGIGLAISKKIIERHGGRIWLKSKPGEGSTFYFSIPSAANAPRELHETACI
jgi:PAS domain S-box-containing protein